MGSLAVTSCWFAASHCALNNSMTTSNILLSQHVYIWCDCRHADGTWRKVPRSLLPRKVPRSHSADLVYPYNFLLVAFGKRSHVERRRKDIASGSFEIKDFHDDLIGSVSFHFVQAHCLSWVTAVAVLCSPSNIFVHHVYFPLWNRFWEYLVACATQPSSIGLGAAYDVYDSLAAFRFLGGLNGRSVRTWFYFWIRLLNDLVGRVLHHHIKAFFPDFEFFFQWRYWEM